MNVTDMTVAELSAALAERRISAVETAAAYSERIRKTADLNNFITVCDDVMRRAQKADEMRMRGDCVSPICGIPVALKDNIRTRGIKTTCASACLKDYVPDTDAAVVKKIVGCGAVMIGKTNMDEFAMGSTNTNSAFGCVKNSLDVTRVAGGSSGGSANSVAARQVPFALGTDTGGSIRQPAAYCGVVGLNPTFSSVDKRGTVGLSPSLDRIGTFTVNCTDAAIVFGAISDVCNEKHKITLHGDVRGVKIGVADEFLNAQGLSDGVKAGFDRAVSVLENRGAIIKKLRIPSFDLALAAYHVISSAEAAQCFTKTVGSVDMRLLGEEVKRRLIIGRIVTTGDNYENIYLKAARIRSAVKQEYENALRDSEVLMCPSAPTTATMISDELDPDKAHGNDMFAAPASLAGLPAVSVPFGFSNGMPVGVQIIGRVFCEYDILNIGRALELSV